MSLDPFFTGSKDGGMTLHHEFSIFGPPLRSLAVFVLTRELIKVLFTRKHAYNLTKAEADGRYRTIVWVTGPDSSCPSRLEQSAVTSNPLF